MLVGFALQGPGFWFLKWLNECINTNTWAVMEFEPKYVATWGTSVFLSVVWLLFDAESFAAFVGADFRAAILMGVGGQTAVRKLLSFADPWLEGKK
jgi:hypothetical protein